MLGFTAIMVGAVPARSGPEDFHYFLGWPNPESNFSPVVCRRHLAAFRAEELASAAEGLRSEADYSRTPLRDKSLPRLQSLLLALSLLHIA